MLVASDKIYKPKLQGGLGLREHELENKEMMEKLWWIWLTISNALWSRIWKEKYVPNVSQQDLIRMETSPKVSLFGTLLGKT